MHEKATLIIAFIFCLKTKIPMANIIKLTSITGMAKGFK